MLTSSSFPLFCREFLRERATADFLRAKDYKGSADHLDKTSSTSSSPMYYPGLAPIAFDVPPMGLDSGVDKSNGKILQHSVMSHQPPHPTASQTMRRPHTPHISHAHNQPHQGPGGPHPGSHLAPHGHSKATSVQSVVGHPSQMPMRPEPEVPEKKNTLKSEVERKGKGKWKITLIFNVLPAHSIKFMNTPPL